MNEVIFTINNHEKIIGKAADPIEKWDCCYDIPLILLCDATQYVLCEWDIRSSMEQLSEMLTKALANELQLHESIMQDIGYLWHEAYSDKPGFVYEEEEGTKLWIGHKYKLWTASGTKSHTITWLYNDHAGAIIFEVTPEYRWEFEEEGMEKDENYISYEEWIKSYKPIAIRKISPEVARQWIKTADEIVKKIDENIARMNQQNADDK